MHRIHVLSICCAYAAIIVSPSPTLAVDLYSRIFEGVTLAPIVTSQVMVGGGAAGTAPPPSGMTVDNSLMPAGVVGNPNGGVTEFEGWIFVDRAGWVATAGD